MRLDQIRQMACLDRKETANVARRGGFPASQGASRHLLRPKAAPEAPAGRAVKVLSSSTGSSRHADYDE